MLISQQKQFVDWIVCFIDVRVVEFVQECFELLLLAWSNFDPTQHSSRVAAIVSIMKQRHVPLRAGVRGRRSNRRPRHVNVDIGVR